MTKSPPRPERLVSLSRHACHGADGPPHQSHVGLEPPLREVGEIHAEPLFEGDVVAAPPLDLPRARQPRTGREALERVRVVLGDLLRQGRARTDEAHLVAYDIPQLWQFVEA